MRRTEEVPPAGAPFPLHALILAAGMGTRLGAITRDRPKALVEVGGESLIARVMRQCVAAGITDFHIVVGYRSDEIRAAVADFAPSVRVSFVESPDFETSNNIVSLQRGLQHVATMSTSAHLILIECDVLLDEGVIPELVANERANIAVVSPFEPGMDGTVVRLTGDRVTELITTSRQGEDFSFADTFKTVNVYRLSPDLWVSKLPRLLGWYIDEVGVMSYYEHAIGMFAYASGDQLHGLVIEPGAWHEVDDPNDLRLAIFRFSERGRARMLAESHGGWWDFPVLDFNYLRNMHFPPPALLAQLRYRLDAALHNYGSGQAVLDTKMSWWLDSEAENTIALSGLASLYPTLVEELDRPDTLIPVPSFGEYRHRYPKATGFAADLSLRELEDTIERDRPATVVIVNPNNPTGTLHPSAAIVELARRHPAVRFFIDESFLPFTDERSVRELAGPGDVNLVVLASLSKNLGVPGLRIGYAWSLDAAWVAGARQRLPIWAMNSLAEMFLGLILKFRREYTESLARGRVEKQEFERALAAIPGVDVHPDIYGDFVLATLRGRPTSAGSEILEALLARGFLVKDVSDRLDTAAVVLRLAVRLPSENELLVAALGDVLSA